MTANGERAPLLGQQGLAKPDSEQAHDDPTKLPRSTRNWILFAVWTAVFLGALDLTLVASILSDVSSSFKQSNQASWLGTSYLLSTATFTPLYGRLCDIIGRRGTVLIALTLFTAGTALCGLAPSMELLIVGRLIAGMGGGGVMSTSSVIASDLVPLKRRALFQGLANCFFGAGSGLGGPLGGWISDTIGWRWAFVLQVPLLLVSIILCFALVSYRMPGQGRTKSEMVRRIDYGGAIFLILALGSLLFGLSFKNNNNLPWKSPYVWASLVVSAVTTVGFVLVEAYYAAEPVLPFRIFKQRNGIFVSLANFGSSWCSFSVLYFYPMFFEVIKGQSAAKSGAHLLPNSIALSCGSLFAGFVIRKTGRYRFLISSTALGPVIALAAMSVLTADTPAFWTWIAIMPSGFGFSVLITAALIALIAAVPRADIATGTGLTYLWRYVGQVVGVAASSSLLQAVLTSSLRRRITGPDAEQESKIIERIRTEASSIRDLPKAIRAEAIGSYATALKAVYIFTLVVAVLTFLTTLPIQEFPLPNTFEEEAEQRAARAETERERDSVRGD